MIEDFFISDQYMYREWQENELIPYVMDEIHLNIDHLNMSDNSSTFDHCKIF